jgi:DNA (cytosine-5)-methyltransferase 1
MSDVIQYGDLSGPLDTCGHSVGVTQQLYSIMPQNSAHDYKARPVDVAQPIMATGPGMGNQGGDVLVTHTLNAHRAGSVQEDGTGHGIPLTVTHALRADGFDASEDGTGRGTPMVVSFESRYARNGRGAPSEIASPLKAQSGQSGKGDAAPLVVIPIKKTHGSGGNGAKRNALNGEDGDPMFTLDQVSQHGVMRASAVRRLTPRECERLQGFPDDYTLIPWRNGMAADGPRYRALGNSMAVPVMAWIGRRIQQVAT